MIDTTKLRELAQKATPGPWRLMRDALHFYSATTIYGGAEFPPPAIPAQMIVEIGGNAECDYLETNARYIAAANPAVVLAMLDELDAMREDLNDARSEFEHVAAGLNDAAQRIARQSQTISRLRNIEATARNLAKVKGRHNSEIAMNQLLEALK